MQNEPSISPGTADIFLKLENYSDIFSDFDIRPYSKRALSVDFIDEIKRAVSGRKIGGVEMILHIPVKEHKQDEEVIIKERLVSHFNRHYNLLRDEKRHIKKVGVGMISAGIFFMVSATLLIFQDHSKNIFFSFLVVFLEPAGWFSFWEGLNHLFFESKKVDPDLDFYRLMSDPRGQIHFKVY